MKKIIIIGVIVFAMLSFAACGSNGYTVAGIDGSVAPGTFARNAQDGTKVATIAQNNLDPKDFAFDYYTTCFEDGDVAHYVENLTTNTSTEIRNINGQVFVTVREYIDGEEHDGEFAGSGMLLSEYQMNPETGALDKLQ